MESPNDEIKKLREDNKRLKEQLDSIEQKQKFRQKRNQKIARKGVELWAGSDLKNSFYKVYNELPNVSKNTFAEFSANILKRFTKIGLITICLALIPTLFVIIQTIIFSNQTKVLKGQTEVLKEQSNKIETQNDLITNQNAKIEKQVYLEEASRRNNLVLLMDNILEKVNDEITNGNKKLSQPLIGRISALAQGFQPYYFLEDSTNLTSRKYSPERGQFLLALANCDIDKITMDVIYGKTIFSSAYLKGAILESLYLKKANLSNANLQGTDLTCANLHSANLNYADLQGADLKYADLQGADLSRANLQGADLKYADLQLVDLRFADIQGADLRGVKLSNADVLDLDWVMKLMDYEVIGYEEIKEKYIVVENIFVDFGGAIISYRLQLKEDFE